LPAIADHLPLRARYRRSSGAFRGAWRQPGGYRRDPRTVRSQPAALGAIRQFHQKPRARRPRSVVLLPYTGLRTVPLALAELTTPGAGGHGLLPPHRYPERYSGRRASGPLLGSGGQGVRTARPLATFVLGRPRAHPVFLRVPGVVAVLGFGDRSAPAHAGFRARLVFCRRPYAAHAVIDA